MGNYPILQIYRVLIIIALVLLIGYTIFVAPQQVDDFGAGLPEEYIEVYAPLLLTGFGLLALIQLIGTVIETANRQREDHFDLMNKIKQLNEHINQLEKAKVELRQN